jgi:hypothetical protein
MSDLIAVGPGFLGGITRGPAPIRPARDTAREQGRPEYSSPAGSTGEPTCTSSDDFLILTLFSKLFLKITPQKYYLQT